ncbi:MAG: choice-of-anchor D domain-containing protein [Acidobacteriaceae bacterium]
MMKLFRIAAICMTVLPGYVLMRAQAVNTSQQVTLAGLRSTNGHGSFPGAAYAADGSLYLLYDQKDGVRVLKLNAAGTTVLAQAQLGATGDSPVALALDPSGNVYVVGTSTSGSLSGTSGTAFPSRADTSTNSFVAKFDAGLNVNFVTFLGAGRTAVASVAASADAVFVTGLTFNPAFPVTSGGIQQSPAVGTTENGFVERFSADGATLMYATYLTGANGIVAPAAIVADALDNAYVAGYTSATGYPTISALVPEILGANSGFLTKLTPAGDGFVFSTFIPGGGMTGLALDAANASLLLSGSVSLGQFPVATVAMPLAATSYQSLLRVPLNGQSVSASVLLVPGTQSFVSAGPNGRAWIAGALGVPLFPGTSQPLALLGDSFAVHVTATNVIDQTLRFGGQPAGVFGNVTLTSLAAAPAVSPDGVSVALPASLTMSLSPSVASSQRFDLPTVQTPQTPNAALPNTLRDVAAACTGMSQCLESAGYLTLLSTALSAASLSVSADDGPNLVVRNLGSATATGLVLTASGFTVASDCGAILAPSNSCSVALTGAGPGSFTVSAANAATETVPLPANALAPNALAVSPVELDFGIETSLDAAALRTLTVTNLSAMAQTFASALDGIAGALPYTVAELGSDCAANGSGGKALAAGAACHIRLGLSASSVSSNDGAFRAAWKVGATDVALTGFTQTAALNVSASEIDFGVQFVGGLRLPRYLFISNNSSAAVPHAVVNLPASSPFAIQDDCPSTLEPHTVCRLMLNYSSASAPSADSTVIALDQGFSVPVTGKTLPQQGVSGSSANPSLSVSPASLVFATPVVVTGISSATQTIVVKNTGGTSLALTASISGDFMIQSGCPATLLGGSSCQILVSFAPSQPGARQGLLAITGGSGFAPAYVALSGIATPILPANNGTLDLGQTLVGEPVVAWFKVQQSLSSLTVASNSAAFGVAIVEDNGFGHGTLSPAGFAPSATGTCSDCFIGIQFLSQTAGLQGATLTVTTVANGNPYVLALMGTALPVSGLLLTPIAQDFGPAAVNSSTAPQLFTLANLIAPGAIVSIASVTASGDFAVVSNTSGGQTCATLAPTASCFVQVVFAPTAVGQRTGTLSVATSAGIVTAALNGNGLSDPGLAINPIELDFNNVPGATALQQSIVLSNTGTTTLNIGAVVSSDPSFIPSSQCATLAPGAACAVTVAFVPGFAPTSGALAIPVTSTVNGQTTTVPYAVTLSGLYTAEDAGLQIVPDVVNFGTTSVGALGVTRLFTLNNLTAKTVAVSFALPRQFPLAVPSTCTSLGPFASCGFSVLYLPATAGAATGTVVAQGIPSDGSAALQTLAYMQGFGSARGTLAISGNLIPNSALNFGVPNSGQSAQQTLTLTNTGAVALTVRRVTVEPPFFSTTTCGNALAPAGTCTVTLTYSPVDQVVGGTVTPLPRADRGTLVVESDAVSSPDVIDLSGAVSPVTASAANDGALLSAFSLSQGSLTFGNTGVGNASAAQSVTLTNTGNATVHVLSALVSTDFTEATNCGALLPGDSCVYTISSTPTAASTVTTRTGTLEIATDASTALDFVTLLGTSGAAPLTLSPTALDFGTVNIGSSGTLAVTISNVSSSPVMLTALSGSGDFAAAYGNCPSAGSALAAGASCVLQVTFTPTVAGTRTGTLSLSTNATTLPLTVALTGNAVVAKLQITPGALAFGTIAVGAPANLSLTLLNSGSAPVTGIGIASSGANAADFAVTVPCSVTTLQPGQGCAVTVTFTPSAVGARSATLSVASSDPSSPATIPLTGSGSAPESFTLTVNGGPSATVTVKSGSPATYPLSVTPVNGFTGAVALTCAPINPGTYASCSINPSTVTLNGGAQNSTVTINTITSASLERRPFERATVFLALLGLPLLLVRRARRIRRTLLLVVLGVLASGGLVGCGGGIAPVASTTRFTPAGSYQYQVTATSTSGAQIMQTVTLNLIVQ